MRNWFCSAIPLAGQKALRAAAIIFAAALAPPIALARGVDPGVLGSFPEKTRELAYLDWRSAQALPWFSVLRDRLLPRRFLFLQRFLAAAGIDVDGEVEDVVWAVVPAGTGHGEQVLGLALGQFSPGATEAYLDTRNLPTFDLGGCRAFAYGTGTATDDLYFCFLDSGTLAFGQRGAIENLLEVRAGRAGNLLTNQTLYPLIQDVNGEGLMWAVFDRDSAAGAVEQFVPQIRLLPHSMELLERIRAMTFNLRTDDQLETRIGLVCPSAQDAGTFAAVLQAGILLAGARERDLNPDLAKVLGELRVAPRDARVEVSARFNQDEAKLLIDENALAILQ